MKEISPLKELPFVKMEAVGNDLILVDARCLPKLDWTKIACKMCDRHFGVGSDGLLVILSSDSADARMRMFNCDGTEDMCGNGLRCVAVYLHDNAGFNKQELNIETLSGIKNVKIQQRQGKARSVTVNMGPPIFAPDLLPTKIQEEPILRYPIRINRRTFKVTCLSMGTPHAVTFVRKLPNDELFLTVSPKIEKHRLFPERTSVIWAKVEGNNRIATRIWERATGESLGCGTGACAALVAAKLLKKSNNQAYVTSKGGSLHVRWDGDVFKTGPAYEVFSGMWPLHGKR